jgi:hypothetical protein
MKADTLGDMIQLSIYTLLHYISQLSRKYRFRIYAGLDNFDNPNELFHSIRPDSCISKRWQNLHFGIVDVLFWNKLWKEQEPKDLKQI